MSLPLWAKLLEANLIKEAERNIAASVHIPEHLLGEYVPTSWEAKRLLERNKPPEYPAAASEGT